MDNYRFDITGGGDITLAMKIAFSHTHHATGYCIRPAMEEKGHRLILFKTKPNDVNERVGPIEVYRAFEFDFDVRAEGAAEIARRFLLKADYPPIPPVSDTNVKGWRLYNETWGHVDSDWRAFAAVTPAWVARQKGVQTSEGATSDQGVGPDQPKHSPSNQLPTPYFRF